MTNYGVSAMMALPLLKGTEACAVITVGGWPSISRGAPCPPERGIAMVTYGELFTYSLVLIGLASLVIQLLGKRK